MGDFDVEYGIEDWDDSRATSGSSRFWAVLAVGAYQGSNNADRDPFEDPATLGKTVFFSNDYLVIYQETIRDKGRSKGKILAHELIHSTGRTLHCSNPSCIYNSDASGNTFCDDCLHKMRDQSSW